MVPLPAFHGEDPRRRRRISSLAAIGRQERRRNSWLCKIVHEAEEIVEGLLGLATNPFGGGHQLHLTLPPQGLQPLSVTVELDPTEEPGTVHAIEITQADANGARGGIRAGIVVT